MIRQLLAVSLALMLVAAAIVGCGGSSNETTTTAPITKAAFLKQANAICRNARRTLLSEVGTYMSTHGGGGKSEGELFGDAIKAVFLPSLEQQVEAIRNLGFPGGDEKQVEAWMSTIQQKIDFIKRQRSLSTRFGLDRIFKPAGELARAYGLEYCGYGEGPSSGA